jgi:hypothetical protein
VWQATTAASAREQVLRVFAQPLVAYWTLIDRNLGEEKAGEGDDSVAPAAWMGSLQAHLSKLNRN